MSAQRQIVTRLDAETWAALERQERVRVARRLAAALGPSFVPLSETPGRVQLACVQHRESKIDFVLVPGGTFRMGIDRGELAEIGELSRQRGGARLARAHLQEAAAARPARTVRVSPFLYARAPLSEVQAALGENPDPALLTAREAARAVERLGFRLPSEAEWEFAAREGGDVRWLGGPPAGGKDVASAVMRACKATAGRVYRPSAKEPAVNALGLWGMPLGEWAADGWHQSYRGAPSSSRAWAPGALPVVRRGGAGALWPWQDDGELIEAHVGMRFLVLESARDVRSFVRVALDLPKGLDWRAGPEGVPAVGARAARAKKARKSEKRGAAVKPTAASRLKARAIELAVARLVPPSAKLVAKSVRAHRRKPGSSAVDAAVSVAWVPHRGKHERRELVEATGFTVEDALTLLIAALEGRSGPGSDVPEKPA